eukprot:jgi/Tetstr1/445600/TSEL_003406.t1
MLSRQWSVEALLLFSEALTYISEFVLASEPSGFNKDLWGGSFELSAVEKAEAVIFYALVMFGVMFLLLRMVVVILQFPPSAAWDNKFG